MRRLAGLLRHLPDVAIYPSDQFQKLAYGERLAAALGTPLTRINGGKHFTPEDHLEDIARAVNGLLAR